MDTSSMGTYGNIRVQQRDASGGNQARCLKYQLSKKGKTYNA
jgi:hypothetical protein